VVSTSAARRIGRPRAAAADGHAEVSNGAINADVADAGNADAGTDLARQTAPRLADKASLV
jgi:hypothetical protein